MTFTSPFCDDKCASNYCFWSVVLKKLYLSSKDYLSFLLLLLLFFFFFFPTCFESPLIIIFVRLLGRTALENHFCSINFSPSLAMKVWICCILIFSFIKLINFNDIISLNVLLPPRVWCWTHAWHKDKR